MMTEPPELIRPQRRGWRSLRIGMTARVGVGLVVSALCLWLALRQVPLDELIATITQVNYWWLLPSVVGNVLVFVPRGYRWRALLANRGTAAEYFWAQAIGALLTNVFPLRPVRLVGWLSSAAVWDCHWSMSARAWCSNVRLI